MNPIDELTVLRTRRDFLTTTASGLGIARPGLAAPQDDVLAAARHRAVNPLRPAPPALRPQGQDLHLHLPGRRPSQIDLFDPKPKLNELHGQTLPESMTKNVRFAFIQKETARLMG